ncbi:ceramide transfer protein-like isoform X1 [Phlebotomus argentipes]|uniref:ceramide transfer protein-like isoform X1 n=1 Tax=Phlebotomus argentipes TaxID=94469 RepID=UPI0028930AD1|nr:ceramide transfer protein-like isoform X1 [Phlebotomus argentipes]
MAEDFSAQSNSDESDTPELKGYLSKWTNYIHGWQPRFIVLKDGTLSYYKSEQESDFGCRGAISLQKATIKSHEFDECRFDVSISNCVWYLRAENPEDKTHWIEVLQSYKTDTSSDVSLRRHGSSVSLQSTTLSTASGSSLKRANRNLREKLHEIETFKDILYGQIETLQRYFDACAEINGQRDGQPLEMVDGLRPIDFKGEAITFRATTAGVLSTLQHCLEMIAQRDDSWRRKLDREIEKRKRLEDLYRQVKERLERVRNSSLPGPDMEEGPHSTLPEDEFFDAVESGLDKMEEDTQMRVRLKLQSQLSCPDAYPDEDAVAAVDEEEFGTGGEAQTHRLWQEIDHMCVEQLSHARQGVGEGGNGWQLFADEGEMKMYRREEEVNGMVIDPLKACHVVQGVTAREMCHYFFSPEYRMDWETTLENMTILETISPDTLVFLQTHKRIWPASQRDALFWSHMRRVTDEVEDPDSHDAWIVCNHSTEHETYPPANTGKCVRIYLTVILYCQTYVGEAVNGKVSRKDLSCKITYCSVVNPGGWAPATVLRAVYKKEYPKFLKRFTQYVVDQCKNKPIMF